MDFLDQTFFGNTVRTWLIGFGLALAVFALLRVVQHVVIGRVAALTRLTRTEWDDIVLAALRRTKPLFLAVVALYAGTNAVALPGNVRGLLRSLTVIAFLIQAGLWLTSILVSWIQTYRRREGEADAASIMAMNAIGFVVRLALWSVILLLALDNLGVDVTALVAGLGVGGIAVALAVQNVLGDLFASLSIVLDKPFVIGDFVNVGELVGTVEHIGLKTTRVRSLSGEQIVFSNADLLGSRIRNFGRMYERRVVFTIGVTYQTPRSKLIAIPRIIREAVEARQKTRFDRSHFKEYAASSIDFETVYFVLDPNFNAYMDIQQEINLQIHERFEAEGIEFAYPTQTVFLAQASA
jgi:small-conductance mechanosensitive channel